MNARLLPYFASWQAQYISSLDIPLQWWFGSLVSANGPKKALRDHNKRFTAMFVA